MYFLVNASLPKRLDVATSNFADALVGSKAGICDGVPSTEVQFYLRSPLPTMLTTIDVVVEELCSRTVPRTPIMRPATGLDRISSSESA